MIEFVFVVGLNLIIFEGKEHVKGITTHQEMLMRHELTNNHFRNAEKSFAPAGLQQRSM